MKAAAKRMTKSNSQPAGQMLRTSSSGFRQQERRASPRAGWVTVTKYEEEITKTSATWADRSTHWSLQAAASTVLRPMAVSCLSTQKAKIANGR